MNRLSSKRFVALFSLVLFFACIAYQPVFAADKLNINTATLEELQTLENVGEVISKRIVNYREKHPFKSIEEIKEVKGIGEKTFQKIKDKISV